jgi:hypothetical protein
MDKSVDIDHMAPFWDITVTRNRLHYVYWKCKSDRPGRGPDKKREKKVKYRKKTMVVEAEQFSILNEVPLPFAGRGACCLGPHGWYVATLGGPLHISNRDWIIKGIKGEFYPCKPDIFEATYELVEGQT